MGFGSFQDPESCIDVYSTCMVVQILVPVEWWDIIIIKVLSNEGITTWNILIYIKHLLDKPIAISSTRNPGKIDLSRFDVSNLCFLSKKLFASFGKKKELQLTNNQVFWFFVFWVTKHIRSLHNKNQFWQQKKSFIANCKSQFWCKLIPTVPCYCYL